MFTIKCSFNIFNIKVSSNSRPIHHSSIFKQPQRDVRALINCAPNQTPYQTSSIVKFSLENRITGYDGQWTNQDRQMGLSSKSKGWQRILVMVVNSRTCRRTPKSNRCQQGMFKFDQCMCYRRRR